MSISFKHIGDLSKTYKFLNRITSRQYLRQLDAYGREGVEALSKATPVDTGLTAASWTAASWRYRINRGNGTVSITFDNTNIQNGVNIAIILDYGHGTGRGYYVQGRHYISPAIQPVFDNIAEKCWEEIVKA